MFARHTQEASQRTYERYEKVCKIPTGCKKGRTGRNPGRALRPNLGFRAVFVPVFSVLGLCGWKGKAPSHGTARSLPCLSRPRPPAAVNPQKWVWRRLPSESGQPGEEGPARKRKRRARREPCKRRAPGRGSCRGHTEGCGSRQGKPKRTAARRRAQPALPAPRRRATPPPAPPPSRPRVPFGTNLPAGRGRGRHSHNAPGRAAAVAAASATASGRRWRKAERRT